MPDARQADSTNPEPRACLLDIQNLACQATGKQLAGLAALLLPAVHTLPSSFLEPERGRVHVQGGLGGQEVSIFFSQPTHVRAFLFGGWEVLCCIYTTAALRQIFVQTRPAGPFVAMSRPQRPTQGLWNSLELENSDFGFFPSFFSQIFAKSFRHKVFPEFFMAFLNSPC
jgi:hypothetical protein